MKQFFVASALIAIVAIAMPYQAAAQHTAPAGSTSTGTAVSSGGGSSSSSGGSSSGGSSTASSTSGGNSSGSSQPSSSDSSGSGGRRRGNAPVTGTAVPRGGQSGGGGPITIGVGGFYPWGYAFGGGLGIYDGFYGGYSGAYDPWYGFSPIYAPTSSYGGRDESGAIRLKVKPSNASVYVDGYYAGVVDDFDGAFQRLHIEPGPHRLEIRAGGYQPLSLDVWITEDLTISYRGDLRTQ